MATLGTPHASEMGEELEKTLMQYCDSIEDCLDWQQKMWLPLQQQLKDIGFRWDKFLAEQPAVVGPDGELARICIAVTDALLPILDSRFKKLKLLQLEEEFRDLKSRLKLATRVAQASKVTGQLLAAVTDENCNRYREAHERLLELKSKQADLDLRRTLLAKLETAAPAWSAAIRNRTGVHGRSEPPRDAASAWTWRQLNDELDRRASVSLEVLQAKSEKLREQLRRVTVELIDKRSWASQARRTSSRQRQALVGWLDTIRRIGKGHGIRVSLLRAEAARKMSECRGAVPVWVMPLSRGELQRRSAQPGAVHALPLLDLPQDRRRWRLRDQPRRGCGDAQGARPQACGHLPRSHHRRSQSERRDGAGCAVSGQDRAGRG